MKYYFAHPRNLYNTRKESVLVDMIRYNSFFSNPEVVNPNAQYHEDKYKKHGIDYLLSLVDLSDCLVYYPSEEETMELVTNAFAENPLNDVSSESIRLVLRAQENGKRVFIINPLTFDIFDLRWKKKKDSLSEK